MNMNELQRYLVEEAVEDYEEGRLTRREALKAIAGIGGAALAAQMLEARAQVAPAGKAPASPAPLIAPDDPSVVAGIAEFPGEGVRLDGCLARPAGTGRQAVVLVCHENRGLTRHIEDVTRRVAKAGYVGLAVDLLSREGGTAKHEFDAIPGILGKAAPTRHVQDFQSGLAYARSQPFARADRVGMTGFCFGGAVTWRVAAAVPDLRAAVPFYGVPVQESDVPKIGAAVLAIYGGLDDRINQNIPAIEIAIRGGTIAAVGSAADMEGLRGPNTQVIDAGGRAVIPGINDAHTHFIRGGLTYTNEVRWDGVPSLAEGLRRVREQARRTPAPHWVQVIGGWTWAQFAEQRHPTLEEINAATGDTPCMIMHLYDRAWLNRAGIRALGWTKDTPNMFGGAIERDASGHPTGLVMSTTSVASLVSVWLRIPRLSPEDQILSTRHFMREHNRLGVTSVIDAGGGGQNYPDNYAAIAKLAADGQMTLRIGYTLFAQAPGKELENYTAWAKLVKLGQGNDYYRMIGTGEYILYAAGDVANFAKDYPVPPAGVMEKNLSAVVKFIVGQGWPFRQHTTFDASASRVLDVLEQVNREIPLKNLRWGLDHCETLKPATLERLAALGGSIDIQNRMSLDGEAFLKKYGG